MMVKHQQIIDSYTDQKTDTLEGLQSFPVMIH